MPKQKYSIGDCFVKTDTGSIHKIILANWIGSVPLYEFKGDTRQKTVNAWLYNCETTHGDERKFLRYYEKRIDKEFYQVSNDSEAVVAIYGS